MIDLPAFNAKQFSNLPIAISTILFGKSDQGQTQFLVTVFMGRLVLQRRAGDANDTTCPTLRSAKLLTGVDYSLTKNLNRQALGFK
jgi:hypothetical protein